MKNIKNTKNGFHLNSKYWQQWKNNRPELNNYLYQICIGMILSDCTMYRISREAYIKFEQGSKQHEFINHLFKQLKGYVFIEELGVRLNKDSTVKSYWFKTFSHTTFTKLYMKFYPSGSRKSICKDIILSGLNEIGLAY